MQSSFKPKCLYKCVFVDLWGVMRPQSAWKHSFHSTKGDRLCISLLFLALAFLFSSPPGVLSSPLKVSWKIAFSPQCPPRRAMFHCMSGRQRLGVGVQFICACLKLWNKGGWVVFCGVLPCVSSGKLLCVCAFADGKAVSWLNLSLQAGFKEMEMERKLWRLKAADIKPSGSWWLSYWKFFKSYTFQGFSLHVL